MRVLVPILFLLLPSMAAAAENPAAGEHMIITALSEELDYSMNNLATPDGTKPYFISYTITDRKSISIGGELGAINYDNDGHNRMLDVDVRVGDYQLDSTHKIRGGGGFGMGRFMMGGASVSLDDDPDAIKQSIWLATDREFKAAVEQYQQVLTNLKTKVDEEDQSADFSKEEAQTCFEPMAVTNLDREGWAKRIKKISNLATNYPLIYSSGVSLSGEVNNRYLVTSEGTKIQTAQKLFRVVVRAGTKAEDGMDLSQSFIFNSATEGGLPEDDEILEAFKKVLEKVVELRDAPIVEPYTGPAILVNRASAVFFHEIFGHRIEGHRQKDVDEGQTFTKKVDQPILPEFLSVYDDPTTPTLEGEDLRGYYKFDDEGMPAQNVALVENGILKTFLMCRSPIKGFSRSNGHGRRSPGSDIVSRMGNTIIRSNNTVGFDQLRALLVEECQRQDKPYGMLFQDISGGFTGTGRGSAQFFKVLPLEVYKVFADGRPDQLVRGVDIVGTPLTCFSQIICTGDDPAVFNGTCGAESGNVPVSGVSPSILVSQMEIEKRSRDQDKPPILPPPVAEKQGTDG